MRVLTGLLLVALAVAAAIADDLPRYEWGKVPPDHLGEGEACLTIRLVDRATRKPVGAGVRLWRLDVPEDDAFSAGDQIQAEAEVPAKGLPIEGLPIGRDRIECDAQRKGAPDPPAFTVATEFRRDFEVDLPRTFTARLAVFDENGRPVERGKLSRGFPVTDTRPAILPDWATPREPKRGSTFIRIGTGIG